MSKNISSQYKTANSNRDIMCLENLTYQVIEGNNRRKVLNDVSFTFEDGKLYTISGPSGSGKTTLLYAMAGLLSDVTGKIYLEGEPFLLKKKNARDRIRLEQMGMIFQNLNLFSFLNVEDNILVPFYVRKERVTKEIKKKVSQYLDMMNLGQIQKKNIQSLSGGEQQRVAIIRAMISNPKLILCDEPTASLDGENVTVFMDALLKIQRERNTTVVIVTHDDRVFQYGDEKLLMVDGCFTRVSGDAI